MNYYFLRKKAKPNEIRLVRLSIGPNKYTLRRIMRDGSADDTLRGKFTPMSQSKVLNSLYRMLNRVNFRKIQKKQYDMEVALLSL